MIDAIIESSAVNSIGWSLIQFAWQGTLIAAVCGIVLATLSRTDARIRYATACLAMVVMVALPVRTAIATYVETDVTTSNREQGTPIGLEVSPEPGLTQSFAPQASLSPEAPRSSSGNDLQSGWGDAVALGNLEAWLPGIVMAWLVGVLALSLRMTGGWLLIRRMRRRGTIAGTDLSEAVGRVARKLRMRLPVRALESALVEVPTVVGWLRPVVLFPASSIAGLSPRQLEAVIAHELAHVRRLDYLVNVFQTVAETLLFYHPAIWWLSRRIRIEREHCADDVAVAACGDAVLYAEALAELEGSRTTTSLAIGATGGSLVTRIRRILGQPEGRHRPASAWLAISTTAVILMLAFTGSGTTAVATPAEPEIALLVSPEAQESQTVTVEPREIEREIEREVLRVVETETEQVEPILNVTVAQEAVAQEAVAQQITIQSVEPVEPILRVAVEPETTIQSVEREIAVAQVQVDPFRRLSALQSIQDTPFGSIRTIGAGDGSYIGIDIQDGAERGVLVSAIADDGPASQAGLEEGDLITSFDGTAVIGVRQFTRLTEETPVGRTVAFTLSRDGQEQIVEVTLSAHPSPFQNFTIAGRGPGDRPIFFGQEGDGLTTPSLRLNERGDFSAPSIVWTEGDGLHLFLAGGQGTLGLTVESMTRELRQFFGADSDEGILIVSIEDESLGAAAGLQVGDVIIAVDGNSVDSDSDVRELARAVFATGNSITLRIVRDRSERDVVVEEESD